MIKTHKPRGHIWSNASAFQETKEYRAINFEECVSKPSETLCRDSDDELSKAQRSAKRRRVEKVADDFLNGTPLFISSARPCPQSLRSTIVWSKKSSNEPKSKLSTLESASDFNASDVIWEEQESIEEILERLKQHHEQSDGPVSKSADVKTTDSAPGDVVKVIEAQASCGPAQHPRLHRINARPSEEALRQPAAIRARRLQQSHNENYAVQHSIFCTNEVPLAGEGHLIEPPLDARNRIPTSWLSRRQSRFSFDGDEVTVDSVDELQLSGSGARSEHANVKPRMASARYVEALAGTGAATRYQPPLKDIGSDETSSGTNSYHTASEHSKASDEPDWSRQRGRAALPKPTCSTQAPSSGAPDATVAAASNSSRCKSLTHNTPQQSSTGRVTPSAALRRASLDEKSKSSDAGRNIPAIHSEPKQSVYITASRSQNGSTPLAYRKGRLPPRRGTPDHKESHVKSTDPAKSFDSTPSTALDEHSTEKTKADGPEELSHAPNEPCDHLESIPERWAGTQFLLNQARRDLIVSPEKQNVNHSSKDRTSSASRVETPRTESTARASLKQLSQEPLPSTQQLIDNFEGWSTIRKPRTGYRESPVSTPTATGKAGWTAINASRAEISASDLSMRSGDPKKQRSKLRFSMPVPPSSNDPESLNEPLEVEQTSPKPLPTDAASITPTATHDREKASSSEGLSKPLSPPLSNTAVDDNLTFSTLRSAPLLSSFQPCQVEGAFSRESSNLNETIDDLTKDMLNMDDMTEVLSQVE